MIVRLCSFKLGFLNNFGLLLNVCINDMMKIDMLNIYFFMLNDLRVLFNVNYV